MASFLVIKIEKNNLDNRIVIISERKQLPNRRTGVRIFKGWAASQYPFLTLRPYRLFSQLTQSFLKAMVWTCLLTYIIMNVFVKWEITYIKIFIFKGFLDVENAVSAIKKYKESSEQKDLAGMLLKALKKQKLNWKLYKMKAKI